MVYGDTDKTAYIDDSYTNADKVYCKERVSNLVGCSITYNIKSDMNVAQFLKDNDLKWVRNQNTGAFGRIMQGKLMIVDTKDRGVLIVLDEMVRTNGRQMTQPEWDAIKEAEKMENF